jgi:hypothetical protein
MMLETPTPPTSRLIPAIAASTPVSTPRIEPSTPRICSWVTALKSVSGWRLTRAATMSSPSCPIVARSGARIAIPSIRSVPRRRWAAVTGMCTSASRSTPRLWPSGANVPITRNRTPPMVIWRPIGSRSPKSCFATLAPRTATRRAVSTSARVRYAPRSRCRTKTDGVVSKTPCMLTKLDFEPARTVSPELIVTATRDRSPTTR